MDGNINYSNNAGSVNAAGTAGWTMTEFNLGESTNHLGRSFELCITGDSFGNSCDSDR